MIDLLDAVLNENMDKLIEILESGVNPDVAGPYGNTAMRNAVMSANEGAVDALLRYGANVNGEIFYKSPVDKRFEGGYRPIYYAPNERMLEQLISAGADVNAKSSQGITALMVFANWCRVPEIEVLIQYGADVDAEAKKMHRGKPITALSLAKECLKTWEKVYKIDQTNKALEKINSARKCIDLLSSRGI